MRTNPNDTVEALMYFQGRDRNAIYWIILAGTVLALVFLFVIKMDVTITARGMIRPTLEQMEIDAPVDGYVVAVKVADNMWVDESQSLFQLNSDVVDAQIRANELEDRENEDSLHDLDELLQHTNASSGRADLGSLRLPAYQSELQYYQSRLRAAEVECDRTTQAWERAQALYALGAVAKDKLEEAMFAARKAKADIDNIRKESVNQWESDRRDRREKLYALRSQSRDLQNQKGLRDVRSPAAGVALGFDGLTRGEYVRAGTKLGMISPSVRTHIEALVAAKDIGFIHQGQKVRVQVDAFPHSRWGVLDGSVEEVSADRDASSSEPVFEVRVQSPSNRLSDTSGASVEATKGMTVTACFVIGRLTLFQMLVESMSEWMNPNDAAAKKSA